MDEAAGTGAGRLCLIPADSLSSATAQTGGMLRSAAISSTQEAIVVNVPAL